MQSGRSNPRVAAGAALAAATIALTLTPLGATAADQLGQSSQQPEAKKQKIVGCDPGQPGKESAASGSTELCVATAIEAWYHATPGSELPPDVPLDQLPEESQYPDNTLHVGQKVGEEEARTYLTFKLSAIPLTAEITQVIVYLPLDEDGGTQEATAASIQACLVNEPPDKNKEGSFEPPPEAECSRTLSSAPAIYENKPRPHLELDLGQLTDLITPTVGIALLPTETETQRTKTWHLAFFSKNNKDEDAEPITARISYRDTTTPTFTAPPPAQAGSGTTSTGSGSGFTFPTTTGGAAAPPGTIDSVSSPPEPQAPADAGQIVAMAPTALQTDPTAYSVRWLVPLALLLAAVFLSFVLNQEVKIPRR